MNSQSKKIENIFFYALLFFSFYLAYIIFSPFLQIILFSILIVIVAFPVHKRIKIKITNNHVASTFSTFFVFLFVLIPGTIITAFLVSEIISFVPVMTKFFTETKDYNNFFSNLPFIGTLYEKIRAALISSNIDYIGTLNKFLTSVANFLIDKGQSFLTNASLLVAGMAFVLLTIFFMFRDGEDFYKKFYDLIPLPETEKKFIFEQIYNAINAIFMGTVLTALAQAILGFIIYFILGVPFSLFWGFVTFITSLFPVGGAAITWIPVAIYCLLTKSILSGIFMVLWGIFVISMADNIIRPILIGDKTNINTLLLILAILGGVKAMGFIGIFIAPIVVILISNLLDIYKERNTNTIVIDAFNDPEHSPPEENTGI